MQRPAAATVHAAQRNSAWRLLRTNSYELAASMQRLLDRDAVTDEAVRKRLADIIAAKRPG